MFGNMAFTRLSQEYQLCTQDNELITIGCNFGLENNNMFTWRILWLDLEILLMKEDYLPY